MNKIKKLSPSAINTFMTCPFQYKCRYIDRVPEIKTPDTTSFGLSIHNIMEHYYDVVKTDTKFEDVKDITDEVYAQLSTPATTSRKTATRKTQESLIRFERERIKKNYGLPTVKEEMMYAKLSDDLPLIRGKPDLYFDSVGLILDWKTGNWGELSDSLKIQGKIYQLILEANGYKPKKVIFDFLVLGKRIILPEVSTSWVVGKVEEMMEKIENNRFPKTKNNLCRKWCGHRLTCDLDGICPMVIV